MLHGEHDRRLPRVQRQPHLADIVAAQHLHRRRPTRAPAATPGRPVAIEKALDIRQEGDELVVVALVEAAGLPGVLVPPPRARAGHHRPPPPARSPRADARRVPPRGASGAAARAGSGGNVEPRSWSRLEPPAAMLTMRIAPGPQVDRAGIPVIVPFLHLGHPLILASTMRPTLRSPEFSGPVRFTSHLPWCKPAMKSVR